MNVEDQLSVFQEFFENYYYKELMNRLRSEHTSLIIDFMELSKFNPELAEMLLETPEEIVKAGEIALMRLDIPKDIKKVKLFIKNLPPEQKIYIRNIRAKHIGKFLTIEGTVRQKSEVRPQVTSATFECPSCGVKITVIQLESKFKEPMQCKCGRKGKFRLINQDLIDAQRIVLEESPKDLDGGEQPKRMNAILQGDLVSPMTEKRTNPGSSVRITGIVKEVEKILKTGGKSTNYDLIIEANFIDPLEEDYSNIVLTEKDIEEIKDISKNKRVYEILGKSLAPGIYGHDKIKEALIFQFVGGVRKKRDDGISTRGDIHILLIGDPGSGKSMLLKRAHVVAPKARYVSGKGVSGAGLTASVVKDEFLGGWSLEAGALVLANRGVVMIDEMDKMSQDDTAAMHEALEQQTVSISKANIQATLRCETTVLAAANPRYGRFDPYESLPKQIKMPSTLINRFDLIFPIKDLPDEDKDKKLANFILKQHQTRITQRKEDIEIIPTETLRKYLVYCRQNLFPVLTDAAIEEIETYYVQMRTSGADESGVMKAIPITARQLEALVRLSEAAAKIRLSDKVSRKDAKKAIELLHYCLEQVGLDPETGRIDIDKIATGITTSQRSKINVIREIINALEAEKGKKILIKDVIERAMQHGIPPEETEETIDKLKFSGEIYTPTRDEISKL